MRDANGNVHAREDDLGRDQRAGPVSFAERSACVDRFRDEAPSESKLIYIGEAGLGRS